MFHYTLLKEPIRLSPFNSDTDRSTVQFDAGKCTPVSLKRTT